MNTILLSVQDRREDAGLNRDDKLHKLTDLFNAMVDDPAQENVRHNFNYALIKFSEADANLRNHIEQLKSVQDALAEQG